MLLLSVHFSSITSAEHECVRVGHPKRHLYDVRPRNKVFVFKRAFACASQNIVWFRKRIQCFIIFFFVCLCVRACEFLFFSCAHYRVPPILRNEWFGICADACLCVCVWYHRDLVQFGSLLFFLLSIFLLLFLFYFISCGCCCCSWVYNGWRYSSESARLTDTKSMIY